MPGSGECPAQQPAPIIGREAGLARLRGLVDPVPQASQVLGVTGEAGMGKTVLLADAADRARSADMRVLSVTGRESESKLAFAGLHQLLRAALSSAARPPRRPPPPPAWPPNGSCFSWAPAGRRRPPVLTAASRSSISSRCPRQTPASC